MPDDLGKYDDIVLQRIREMGRRPLQRDTKQCEYCRVIRSVKNRCHSCGAP